MIEPNVIWIMKSNARDFVVNVTTPNEILLRKRAKFLGASCLSMFSNFDFGMFLLPKNEIS